MEELGFQRRYNFNKKSAVESDRKKSVGGIEAEGKLNEKEEGLEVSLVGIYYEERRPHICLD